MGSIRVQEKGKEMGNRNITPIATLKHCRNILFTVDVVPGIRVIDIIIVCIRGGRTSIVKLNGRGVDTCGGSVSAMGSMEGSSRRGRRELVCQWRGYWMD